MNEKHHFVYLTVNKLNGKCYIGSHSTNNLNDSYLGSGNILKTSIKKYGKDSFKRIIVKKYITAEKSRLGEEKYIQLYESLVPNGYNISPTGGVPGVRMLTDESKYRCGSTNRGKKSWMSGKKHTEEAKELNRQKHLGKKDSKETLIKKSKATKGKNNPMYGKSIYSIWLEKYGKNVADEKEKMWKENIKMSKLKRKNNN